MRRREAQRALLPHGKSEQRRAIDIGKVTSALLQLPKFIHIKLGETRCLQLFPQRRYRMKGRRALLDKSKELLYRILFVFRHDNPPPGPRFTRKGGITLPCLSPSPYFL